MTVEEFKKMLSDVKKEEQKEKLLEEERKKRVKIQEEKNGAIKYYDSVIIQKEVFPYYEKLICEYFPEIIEEMIAMDGRAIINNSNYKVKFDLDFYDPKSGDRQKYKSHNPVPMPKKYCAYMCSFVSDVLRKYGADIYKQNDSFIYVNITITNLFRAYVLEKNHALDNMREDINSLLEDFDDSLKIPSNDKIKTKK